MSDTISPQSPVVDDGSTDGAGQKRLLLVVGGAALLLVLGLGAYFLFLSGGEEEDLGPVPSAAGSQPTEDPVKKDKGSKKDKAPKDVNADFTVGRDPFVPLSVEAVNEPEPAPEPPTTDHPVAPRRVGVPPLRRHQRRHRPARPARRPLRMR